MPSLLRKPDKWIAAEIARLDPEVDWLKITRLMNTYSSNDFVSDLIYAYAFPHFMVPFHGSAPVWRDGDNAKVVKRGGLRSMDTNTHNFTWAYYGPDHPETRKSVGEINRIHAHYAKQFPDSFAHHEDYVYTWSFSAALMHRLRLKMGLPGYTENEQIAAHRFWKEMSTLFVVPGSTDPIEGYADDFAGVVAWLEDFESRNWPVNETGKNTSEAVLQQFLFRRVPARLRPLVRTLVYSLSSPGMLRAYEIAPPHPAVGFAVRRLAGLAMTLGGRLTSDPRESVIEQSAKLTDDQRREDRRVLKQQDESFAKEFTTWIHSSDEQQTVAAGCPHPMGQRVDGSA